MAMAEPFNNVTETRLIKQWMPRKRGETYTALDNGLIDFQWSIKEVDEFIQLWKDGASIMRLSGSFHRPQKDIGVLIMDLSLKNKIQPREKGIWG